MLVGYQLCLAVFLVLVVIAITQPRYLDERFTPNRRVVFITFGAGGQNYIDAGNRLVGQAKSTGLFDQNMLYTEDTLRSDPDFWEQHHQFIQKNPRGYGYWLWKPYLIQKTMNTLRDGDIILYLDCGCEIDAKKRDQLRKYMEYVLDDHLIGTQTFTEKDWNKMDLVKHLNATDSEYLDTAQLQAGAIMLLVNVNTRNLVDRWYRIMTNYHYIDDTPSESENVHSFKEHRHDQSVFSLLAKKHGFYNKRHRLDDCVELIRNKTGGSMLK